jgi:hypothetical protein
MRIEKLANGKIRVWSFVGQPQTFEMIFDEIEGLKACIVNMSNKLDRYLKGELGNTKTLAAIQIIRMEDTAENFETLQEFNKILNDGKYTVYEMRELLENQRKEKEAKKNGK